MIFPPRDFINVKILNFRGNHVEVSQGGMLVEYEIGHLPEKVLNCLCIPGLDVDIIRAGCSMKNALGVTSGNVIEDVRENSPCISSIAFNFIKEMSFDPQEVFYSYLDSALKISETSGFGKVKDGIDVQYKSIDHCLHVFCKTEKWEISSNTLLLKKHYPDTICSGSIGRKIKEFVEHPMFPNNARIIDCENISSGTKIVFTYEKMHATIMSDQKKGN